MSMTEIGVEVPERSMEQDLADAKKATAGEAPLIPKAPNVIVHLPRGYYQNGEWITEVEVRELTGADEEALARFKEIADFFNGVVTYGTARIGSIDLTSLPFAERSSYLASLLIGERDQLFVHIASATYGDMKEISHTCPSCSADMDTTVILSEDLKAPEMESPYMLTRTLTTGLGVITYRLATGSDQMAVLARKGASVAEQNTIMLSECITQVDGKPVLDPMGTARNLSMGDRRRLLDDLMDNQPSADLSLKVPCASCGFEMTLTLGWADIFRP